MWRVDMGNETGSHKLAASTLTRNDVLVRSHGKKPYLSSRLVSDIEFDGSYLLRFATATSGKSSRTIRVILISSPETLPLYIIRSCMPSYVMFSTNEISSPFTVPSEISLSANVDLSRPVSLFPSTLNVNV